MNDMSRALQFGQALDFIARPTPAMLWLEQAAAKLSEAGDPVGEKKARRDKVVARLLERDGGDCWFCGKPLAGDISIEHLTPRALGGSWDEDNLALAHRGCNRAAGHLSRIKKEHLREQIRADIEPEESK